MGKASTIDEWTILKTSFCLDEKTTNRMQNSKVILLWIVMIRNITNMRYWLLMFTDVDCRYGIVKDKEKCFNLFSTHIPCVRDRRPAPCYIVKWETGKYTPSKVVKTGTEILSALTVRYADRTSNCWLN